MLVLGAAGCAHKPEAPLTPEEVMSAPDARMRSIVLNNLELINVTLEDALQYLSDQSKQADPDKVGVVIAYRPLQLTEATKRVTARFPQATVLQVVEELCRQTDCGYLIEKDKVTLLSQEFLRSLKPKRLFPSTPRL
jgi:hypothetical protein